MNAPALVALAFAIAVPLAAPSARAQQHAPPPLPVVPLELTCRGEEPFWSFEAGRTSGRLNRLGGKKRQVVEFRGSLQSLGFLAPKALVWRGDSTQLPAETLVATLREESCSSTMKEGPPQAWRAILSVRAGEAVTGCCTLKSGYDATMAPHADFATKPEGDWSRDYPALAGAIQRCVNDGGVAVSEVAKAWRVDRTRVAVRLVATDGKPWNCTVDTSTKARPQLASVAATDPPLAGAGAPVFYPARETPPVVACGRLERVAGAGGRSRTEGWLHYDRC